MKLLIEQLASGNAVFETPDVEISEKHISLELKAGESRHGQIHITGKNDLPVKGVVYTTDHHIAFEKNQFFGINNIIYYTAYSDNLEEGQVLSGTISIITTGGDYAIAFSITVKKDQPEFSIGIIKDLQDFVRLVRNSYDEALLFFLSKKFKSYFLMDDSFAYTLYMQVIKNQNRHIAMEEFLVGMGFKERVHISLDEYVCEYGDMTENYSGTIRVHKSSWGHIDVDVTLEGDFFYNGQYVITGQEFNGKIAEYRYYINANRLHGGCNYGRIVFETVDDTIVYEIHIVNQKENIDDYICDRKSRIVLVKNYLAFRTGVTGSKVWIDKMMNIARNRLERNSDDLIGLLAKAHSVILKGQREVASAVLNKIEQLIFVNQRKYVEEYCYYLYLKTLYKNNSDDTHRIKEEIKTYFEEGYDTWRILWLLFYTDERYKQNPGLKYAMIKRMFQNGCTSPVMYYEAVEILQKQPELLRVLTPFEVQILNFAGKYRMVHEGLAEQLANLLLKERDFHRAYFNLLVKFYDNTKHKAVLEAICSMIIRGHKTNGVYFRWLELGVKNELKITNLYEYYVYTVDTGDFKPFANAVYRYFSYGTDTLVHNKDYFFANLIINIHNQDSLFLKYEKDLTEFTTEQILLGKNNRFLRIIYNKVLTEQFILDGMKSKILQILHTYEIRLNNPKIQSVMVCHKETTTVQKEVFNNNVAYVQIDTDNPVLIFIDKKGRFLSKHPYEIESMKPNVAYEVLDDDMVLLNLAGNIIKNPKGHRRMLLTLQRVSKLPFLSEQYQRSLREFTVDYCYKGLDDGDGDEYLQDLDMEQLTVLSRNKVIETLIRKNLLERSYAYITRYGYAGIQNELLEHFCLEMIQKEEYDGNELLTQMSAKVFRNGCRKLELLLFLAQYYESGSLELIQLFLSIRSKDANVGILTERLLIQLIFESTIDDKLYAIYQEYLNYPTSPIIRRAFYTYVTYQYFIKNIQCPEFLWEILEREYGNGFQTTLITQIAFLEVLSKRDTLTENQVNICKNLLEYLGKHNINLDFLKKFNIWFKVPFHLLDKTVIDFCTNPKHKVEIEYRIGTSEGFRPSVKEEMASLCQGIFTKEVVMFYDEEMTYHITEYSQECPEGKTVVDSSKKITDKNLYNDDTGFGMINGMIICQKLGRNDAAREIMQLYELQREVGKDLFRLL